MQAIWKEAGLTAIETEVIRIRVSFPSFDDFWDSNTVPVGTVRQSALGAFAGRA